MQNQEVPPLPQAVKINVDAALCEAYCKASVGVITRNEHGEILYTISVGYLYASKGFLELETIPLL